MDLENIKICALGALYKGDKVEYLEESLSSLASQTITIPIFIVIDGPISKILESKLSEFIALDINYIRLDKNLGLAKALSHAVDCLCEKFDYIIRFDFAWAQAFSPKVMTLKRNEFRGPYKTEMEMKEQLRVYNGKDKN